MPELRQLRTFVAVAEELSFTRAAERLHLGQQAVSKAVAQLERELGVSLLERTTREVRLTAAGRELLAAGRDALSTADAAFERARQVGRGLAGTVRVGVTAAIAPPEREQAARALRTGTDELTVSLRELPRSEIPSRLHDRTIDLALARTSPASDAVQTAALRPTATILCTPEAHPLAAHDAVRLAQLDGMLLLTWSPPGTPFTDLLTSRIAAAGATVDPTEANIKGGALAELIDQDAVALMPAGWPHSPGIAQIPLSEEITLPLLVLWRAGQHSLAVERIRTAMAAPTSRGDQRSFPSPRR